MTIKPMGEVISIERIKQGLSMAALAKRAKISAATVYNLENRRGSVSPTTAKKVCEAMDKPFEKLFEIE